MVTYLDFGKKEARLGTNIQKRCWEQLEDEEFHAIPKGILSNQIQLDCVYLHKRGLQKVDIF